MVSESLDYISPEEQLRRLAYCVKFLPSPLYKKERLMPTNPIAQRRCIEEYKAREKRKREERRKELKERRKYLDEEKDKEEEKEEEEKAAKKIKLDIMERDLKQKTLKELCAYLDEEEEEEEKKQEKEEKAKKMKLHIKIPRGEVTAKAQKRRQPIPTTRRKKQNQTNFHHIKNTKKLKSPMEADGTNYISPEEQLRRLAYCVKFLPSPLYKKERLMPTNPIAQRRCIEEYKAREKRKREERRKELKERRKYLDEEEDEEEEKEEEEKAAKKIKLDIMDLRQKTLKELCAYLDEEEEEEEKKEQKAKKMKLHIKIPRGEVTAKAQKRRQPIPTTRRKKQYQTNFSQYINRYLRGKRNIMWTILLGSLCR
ncbi:uncharacterized protein [Phyllobates terribilis]|uniref:uncharacterized protein n=1 Tax=Phyllobates terribilis TaxID=111132 RepID=UPI003CCAC707